MVHPPSAAGIRVEDGAVRCSGSWTLDRIDRAERALRALAWPVGAALVVDASAVGEMDTAGAWLLERTARRLGARGRPVTLRLRPEHEPLLALVTSAVVAAPTRDRERARLLAALGRRAWTFARDARGVITFCGEIAVTAARARNGPLKVRVRQTLQHVQAAGFEALPTAALLSFFLGVVLAYQGATLLRPFGAGILVADLVGLAMLRELSPLVTALIVAGRSGSAYAAQVGAMKMAGEIDSLRAVGLAPIEVLVLPRIAALALVLPLLTVAADVFSVSGAMLVASIELGTDPGVFLGRVVRQVHASSYVLGVGKALVFGMIIGTIGCHQGLKGNEDADSVGRQTTRAVVQSVFLVVLGDAFVLVVARRLGL